MTEKEYSRSLKRYIKELNPEDRTTIMEACKEHFQEGQKKGMDEQSISKSLGSPEQMARESKEELGVYVNLTLAKAVRIFVSSFSLLIFNLIFVLGPYIGLMGVLLAMWVVPISILISGFAFSISAIFPCIIFFSAIRISNFGLYCMEYLRFIHRVGLFFSGISLIAFGGLLIVGMIFASRWVFQLTKKYLNMILKIIRGEK